MKILITPSFHLRVMYIKCHSFLLKVGVKRFVSCLKWSAFTISLTFTLGHSIEHLFFVNPSNMVFYSYFRDQKTHIVEFKALFDNLMVTSCLLTNLVELILFAIIIYELAKQYFNRVRINMKNTHGRKNAITAFGHFISWTVELLLFGISNYIIVAHKDVLGVGHWVIFMLLPSMNYIFPTVQILTSPDLRHYAFGFMCCSCSSRKSCASCPGHASSNQAGNEEFGINEVPLMTVNHV